MKLPLLLARESQNGLWFLQRHQICQSILPPSEQQLGSTEPPQIFPGTQEGNPQPSLPTSSTESEAKAALGDEEPKQEAKNQQK